MSAADLMPGLGRLLFMRVGGRDYSVASLKDASEKFCAARDASGLGASRVRDPLIVDQNAVTRMAQDVESYDRATELERLGAQVIELPRTEWQAMAIAA